MAWPGRVAHRRAVRVLLGLVGLAGARAVLGSELRHLRVRLAAGGLERVDAHVVGEALRLLAGVDLLAGHRYPGHTHGAGTVRARLCATGPHAVTA